MIPKLVGRDRRRAWSDTGRHPVTFLVAREVNWPFVRGGFTRRRRLERQDIDRDSASVSKVLGA
jgi:hypothetical protein